MLGSRSSSNMLSQQQLLQSCLELSREEQNLPRISRTWCSSAKRENFKYFHFFMFLSWHSNYENIARMAHSHCKKIAENSMLERILDYDEYLTRASRSNTGTLS